MEKPKSFNLMSQALIVTCTCLCGAILSSVLLYRDIQNIGLRSGLPVAKLQQTESKVRLKPANSFVWAPAHSNEDLYTKDSIQTPEMGEAAVRFNDGTVLEMGENSLIVIDQLSNLALSFVHGSGVLHTQSGDSQITLDKSGKAKIEKLTVRLLKPTTLAEILTDKSKQLVHFQWELLSKSTHELTLEVASDRKFKSRNLKALKLSGVTQEVTLELPVGRYFWRVLGEEQALVAPAQFKIENIQPLKPLYPIADQKLSVFTDSDSVEFNWEIPDVESAISDFSSKIEVSLRPDFQTRLASQDVVGTSGSAHLKNLVDGPLYWRIVSKLQDGAEKLEVKSAVEKFSLEKLKKAQIALVSPESAPPVLKTPIAHQEFHYWNEIPSFNLSWSTPDSEASKVQSGEESYLLEVANSPDFKGAYRDNLKTTEVSSQMLRWNPGAQYWRVSVIDASSKRVLKTSAVSEFFFGPYPVLRAPASVSPDAGSVYNPLEQETPLLIHWAAVEDAVSYDLVVQLDGKTVVQQNIAKPQFELKNLKPGKYKYFVMAVDRLKRKGEPTAVREIEVTYGDTLAAPEALSPEVQ
jgi:hypothetical protein